MKKMKKLSAAVALVLSMGVASQVAQAEILLKHDGKGDALLFPVYNAHVDNYFTISNNDDKWIQGHLRFRGAAWSAELLDMDIILTPGDVFVFRVADVDGDGDWELDQSLDQNNFSYTGYLTTCKSKDGTVQPKPCMDFSTALVPATNAVITTERVEHHLKVGYIEFIGEAVLENMDHTKMAKLLSNNPPVDLAPFKTQEGNGKGVTAWSWSDAAHQFRSDQGLGDVPNVLSGTAFISLPGESSGIAYNAEAFVNFRTAMVTTPAYQPNGRIMPAHRIDNYRMSDDVKNGTYNSLDNTDEKKVIANRAVIVHDESVQGPGTPEPFRPFGDYVCRFDQENLMAERIMSFQNTWGPTLADGDDYELMGVRPTYGDLQIDPQDDDFDADPKLNPYGFGVPNSIAEVEEAIRRDGQTYTSYYFDHKDTNHLPISSDPDGSLSSQYFVFFPTKVFWHETSNMYGATNFNGYLTLAVQWLLSKAKPYCVELWDTTEQEACRAKPGEVAFGSPFVPSGGGSIAGDTTQSQCGNSPACSMVLGFELNFFNIGSLKTNSFPKQEVSGIDLNTSFLAGRVVFDPFKDANNPFLNNLRQSWPALMYTFELNADKPFISHWRRMQR
jgi:hypothetical protein